MNLFDVLFARKLAHSGEYPPVIKRKTGNPIEITDAAAAPLVKCVTQIQGSQDLHGQDKPWVGGAGKNLAEGSFDGNINSTGYLDISTQFSMFYAKVTQGETYTVTSDSDCVYGFFATTPQVGATSYDSQRIVETQTVATFTAPIDGYVCFRGLIGFAQAQCEKGSTATSYEPYSNLCPITAYTEGEIEVRGRNLLKINENEMISSGWNRSFPFTIKSGNYIFSCQNKFGPSANQGASIGFFDSNGTLVTTCTGYDFGGSSLVGSAFFVTEAESKKITQISFRFRTSGATFQDIADGEIMLETGRTPNTYEPYTSTTHTTTFPSAIYRGSEDVVEGTETHDMVAIDLGSLNYSAGTDGYFYSTDILSDSKAYGAFEVCNALCSIAEKSSQSVVSGKSVDGTFAISTGKQLMFYISAYAGKTGAEIKTLLTGQTFAYELATPTTSSVTPTNLPIKSLSGYNHIESSTGDMVVDYITDAYQNFVDTTERALPNTRKGGVKAMDIFLSLEKKDDKDEPKEEQETKEEATKR